MDAKQTGEMTSLAANMAVGQAKNYLESNHLLVMKTWAGDGPMSFRMLALCGGGTMAVLGFLGVISSLLNPFSAVVSLYFLFFGCVIVMLEAKNKFYPEKIRTIVVAEFKFLMYLNGRGAFYVFVGTLLMSQSSFIESLLGLYMVIVGCIMIGVGSHANNKLSAMKSHITDEAAVISAFNSADKDQNGFLTATELAELCKTLGSELSTNELEAAVLCLDTDGSGHICQKEFLTWWTSTTVPVEL